LGPPADRSIEQAALDATATKQPRTADRRRLERLNRPRTNGPRLPREQDRFDLVAVPRNYAINFNKPIGLSGFAGGPVTERGLANQVSLLGEDFPLIDRNDDRCDNATQEMTEY